MICGESKEFIEPLYHPIRRLAKIIVQEKVLIEPRIG